MVNEYITRANLEAFLGLTIPAARQAGVDEIISQVCDEFDRATGNAWRVLTVRNEMHRISLTNNWVQAQKIYLYNRNVKQFSAGAGDKWEVWNGTEWENWLSTKAENTDWFAEYPRGILYIRPFVQYPLRTFNLLENIPMRFTYRYGDVGVSDDTTTTFDITKVPGDIKRAIVKMAAINLIQTQEWYKLLPEGTDRLKLVDKVAGWQADVDRIILNRKEIKV